MIDYRQIEKELNCLGGMVRYRDGVIYQVGIYHSSYSSELFEILNSLPELEILVFYVTNISDEDLIEVSNLKGLKVLALMSCEKITDLGISNLLDCHRLRKLSVLGTRVTLEGAEKLVEKLPRLEITNIPTSSGSTIDVRGRCSIDC